MTHTRTIEGICTLTGKTDIAHNGDAGIDVFYQGNTPVVIEPLHRAVLDTEVTVSFDNPSYFIAVCPRSGLAFNNGITVANAPGIIDTGFTGNIKVCLVNISNDTYTIEPGDKIAQLVISHNYLAETTSTLTERNSNGFGSTG